MFTGISQSVKYFKVPPRARGRVIEYRGNLHLYKNLYNVPNSVAPLSDVQSSKWCEWSCLCFARPPRTRAKALEGEALPPADKTRDLCRVGCLPDRSYRYRSWPGSCVSLGVRESKVWAHISFMGVRLAPRYRGLRFSGHVPLCRGTTTWHEQAGSICG